MSIAGAAADGGETTKNSFSKKKMSDSGQNQGIQPDLAKIVHNAFLEINFAHKINF
jgi:hypothetical protein